mmetsp:Transcript_115178/g.321968  ORF Transcript_115178/g.321968 Transcript_115178/m.321968 type:complete len:107 (+) Transcript_115178:70-390(+)
MVLTTLGRAAARGALASRSRALAPRSPLTPGAVRFGSSDYDYNLGFPGSRIKNPAPKEYDDVYPGLGRGWWALVTLSTASFIYGNMYDMSRPVNISIGIFGPNLPV